MMGSAPAQGMSPLLPGETAALYAERVFGGRTKVVETRVTVGTTVTPLMANNPRRIFWLAVNNGPNAGALGFDPSITTVNGVVMGPNGGFSSMSVFEDGEGVSWGVNGIQSVAAAVWYVMEVMQV